MTDPERRSNREYTIRDILLEEVRDHPKDTRASFYLARTYNVLRNHSAALKEFQRRISLGGWAEEIYESYYAIAFQREAMGEPWPAIHDAFLDAHAYAPERGEPLFNIAQHYWQTPKHKALAYLYAAQCASLPYPKHAVLWVQADVYNWQCLMYQGLAGILLPSKMVEGYTALLRALNKRPNDQPMLQARTAYQSKLSAEQRTKAECAAGINTDAAACAAAGVALAAPCAPCATGTPGRAAAAGAADQPGDSVAVKIASDPTTPEQSNFGVDASVANAHIPASLRGRYGSPTFDIGSDNKFVVLFVVLLALCILALGALAIKQTRILTWLQLKVLGGKKAHASGLGSAGRGDKFV